MFNVIVAYNSTAWETDQLMRMDDDRFKEYSGGPESDRVELAKPATMKLLEGIPTLLFYESGSEGAAAKVVRYGTVHDVHTSKDEVVFRFTEEGRFTRTVLEEYMSRLDIGRFESNRTHWAVKEGGIPSAMMSHLRLLSRHRHGEAGHSLGDSERSGYLKINQQWHFLECAGIDCARRVGRGRDQCMATGFRHSYLHRRNQGNYQGC